MEQKNFRDIPFNIYRSECVDPGQIVIFHGICEHSYRYIPFIKQLNEIGFDCTLIDHPGHGQHISSEVFNNDFYHFYEHLENDFATSLEKVKVFSEPAKNAKFQKRFLKMNKKLKLDEIINFQNEFFSFLFKEKIYSRNKSTFILGQSMGGLIASIIGEEKENLAGIILLSPAFKAIPKPLNETVKTDQLRHKIESTIINKSDESFTQKSLFNNVVLNPLLGLNPTNDCSWASRYISDIGEINELFSNDPYIGSKLSLKFLQSIQYHMKKQRECKEEYPFPVFIEFGMDDKIVSSEGSEEFIHNRLTGYQHFIKPLKDFKPHEIHNSQRRNYLLSDLREWAGYLS